MILAVLLLLSGLTISAVAIYYSVMGLMAIFSAAAVPIMVMGVSLEIGKLVTASWVKQHWTRLPILMKSYAVVAVAILMFITSLGIFGFLSKAHSDQTLVSGDVQSKIAVYDEKIRTARENIDADRKAIKQMDDAVDQVLGRSTSETGADKAVAIRRGQAKERARLAQDIETEQKKVNQLMEDRAPIAAEVRKVEAEVGPIKYIAAFIYGENPDANILEKAVTWVIILIVVVFDPLAVVMLLAAQMTFEWIREERELKNQPKYEQDDGPLSQDQIDQLKEIAQAPEEPVEETIDPILCYKCGTPLIVAPGIGPFCPNRECDVADATSGETVEFLTPATSGWMFRKEKTLSLEPLTETELAAMDDTLPDVAEEPAVLAEKNAQQLPFLSAIADNELHQQISAGFGTTFPVTPTKGDMYLRVDYLPPRLFKWNKLKWVEVDRNSTDSYAYNEAYIPWLIEQLATGKYDADIITDVEHEQIESYLAKVKHDQ